MAHNFKVGDRVRTVRDGSYFNAGLVGVIDDADSGWPLVDFGEGFKGHAGGGFPMGGVSNGTKLFVSPCDLELVTCQFKVGDKGKTRGVHDYKIVATDSNASWFGTKQPVRAVITRNDGGYVGTINATVDGYFFEKAGSTYDLMPPEPQREPWEVAMESGDFYFRSKFALIPEMDYHATASGGGFVVAWGSGGGHHKQFFGRAHFSERFNSGDWYVVDAPATPKPDPVAEAAAAYKAAVAALEAADNESEAAYQAWQQALERGRAAYSARDDAQAKLLEVSAAS